MILNRHPSQPDNRNWIGKRFVGYWQQRRHPYEQPYKDPAIEAFLNNLPDPHDFVDETWDPAERAMVVEHLKLGTKFVHWLGYSWCRFGCKEYNGPNCCTFDGSWVFPQGLAHYVEAHGVRVPQAFVDHIRSLPPALVDELRLHIANIEALLAADTLIADGSSCASKGVSCHSSATSMCVRGNTHSYRCQDADKILYPALRAEDARHAAVLQTFGFEVQGAKPRA